MSKVYLRLLFFIAVFAFVPVRPLVAQTTNITTATGTTGYTATNGLTGSCFITFVVENTNGYPIILNEMEDYKSASYPSVANPTFTLWYSSTSVSGAVAIASPDWTQITTSSTANMVTGYNTIFTNLGFTIPPGAQYRFALQSNSGIAYSGSAAGNCSPSILTAGGVNLKLGEAMVNSAYVGYSGAFPTSSNSPRWFTGSITFQPAGPCTSPPVAGYIKPSVNGDSVTTVCNGSAFRLQIVGGSGGIGQTYQWQSSANGTAYTNIPGDTTSVHTGTQTASTYYRAITTCSGMTATTAAVRMLTPALVSGTFTINSAVATGGTNFQSFGDAINYIKCGISGRTTFTVAAGSGPYNEQVTIPQISGVSATNPLVINGNGRTLNFNSTNSNERAGIKLDGADYVTIDNLVINGTGTTTTDYNFGIQLINDANNNTISNCTVNIINSSTSLNFAGIVISGLATSATGSGASGSGNTITGNTVSGGYYGITNVGTSTTVFATGNRITNNTIIDFYIYGIYMFYASGTLVEGNDINRRTRSTNLSTFYGIYLSTSSQATFVFKNRIHDPFTALSTASTSLAAGIYLTGADGKRGLENVIGNNLIYNFTNGGTLYGLYNFSSDSTLYYFNTVALDDSNYVNTSTSYIAYGFYQSSAATGIELKNNLFRISRGGAGNKFGLYFATAANTIVSNNNNLAVAGATGNYYTGYLTTSYSLLTDWQNNSGQDAASVAITPLFTAPATGNFKPRAPELDNRGVPAGITTDIVNNPRSTTTPDLGAFEFGPPLPIKLLSLSAAKVERDIRVSWTAAAENAFSHYEVERSANGADFAFAGSVYYQTTGNTTNSYSFLDKEAATLQIGLVYYRLKMVDKDGRSAYSGVVTVRLKGAGVAVVKTYPNPFKSAVYLQIESTSATRVQAVLTDAAGRVMLSKNYAVLAGSNVVVLDGLDKLQPGTYLLTTDMNGQKTTLKVTKS